MKVMSDEWRRLGADRKRVFKRLLRDAGEQEVVDVEEVNDDAKEVEDTKELGEGSEKGYMLF